MQPDESDGPLTTPEIRARYDRLMEAHGMPAIRDDGASLIAAERERQRLEEGWTPEHDDTHTDGQLKQAAAAYLAPGPWETFGNGGRPSNFPWAPVWWKPSDDPIRTLVKAGALIAAEIDRLTRAAALPGERP